MRKASIIVGVIFIMILSIFVLGIFGPILVSLALELLARWAKKKYKKEQQL